MKSIEILFDLNFNKIDQKGERKWAISGPIYVKLFVNINDNLDVFIEIYS